ncbi:MAG: GFA family protein [Parvularculaceae bacterium]
MTERGQCHCGAVRFEAEGEPKFVTRCHCESCRRTTGAAFSTWVGFRNEQVKWLAGEPAFYASSEGVKRGSCRKCGTPLTFQSEKWPGETHLLIGVFKNPECFQPKGDYQSVEALSWVRHWSDIS